MHPAAGIDLLCNAFKTYHQSSVLSSMRAFPASQTVMTMKTNGVVQTIPAPNHVLNRDTLVPDICERIQQHADDRTKLLGLSLVWLLADVYGMADVHESLLHPNANMFGHDGKENILKFKRQLLSAEDPNYYVDAIPQVDLENRAVVADFDCLIPGKEGRGTDVVKFTPDYKVIQVEAIRHGVSMDWSQKDIEWNRTERRNMQI